MSTLTEQLVEGAFAAVDAVPADVERAARLHLADSIGVAALAARRGPLAGLQQLARGRPGSATVIGAAEGSTADVAALINGSFIHSLEFDDTHVASVVHGSATLTPAALAAAEAAHATGARLVASYAVGWEVLIRLGLAAPGALQGRGFQTTSTLGAFAAALVASLVSDDSTHAIDALGIASTQPGGTFAFLDRGDTVKATQPAWAAHAGIWAVDLARAGVGGPRRALDGPYGFYRLYAGEPAAEDRLRELLGDLGSRWHLPDAAYKLLPCCHFIHPFVETTLRLIEQGLVLDELETLTCDVPTGAIPVIAEPWGDKQHPANAHQGRWSLPYTLAGVLLDGELRPSMFDGSVDSRTAAVVERIAWRPWPDSGFPARFPARVTAVTRDGRTLTAEVDDVAGSAGRPVAEAQVVAKLMSNLAAAGTSERTAARLVGLLLEKADFEVGELAEFLR